MLKKLLFSFLVPLFAFGSAFAQTGNLSGTVTDQGSGETLPGVNIFIPELKQGTATDAQGEFVIEDIEYGTYTVRATYVGYDTFEQEVTIDQESTTMDIALSSEMQQLEDVVVTAYGVERQANDLPYSAQNVDTEELTEGGANNFMDALSGRVAGMKVRPAAWEDPLTLYSVVTNHLPVTTRYCLS